MPCFENRTTILSQAGWDKALLAKALLDLGVKLYYAHGSGGPVEQEKLEQELLTWIDRSGVYDGTTLKLTPGVMAQYKLTPEKLMRAYSRQVVARDAARMGFKVVRKSDNQDVLVRIRS